MELRQALIDVPYVPLGRIFQPTPFQADISGVPNGFAIFWTMKRM